MVSIVFHEIAEAASDPTFHGWFDSHEYENADLCAWRYGTLDNWNVQLGTRSWLLQQLWVHEPRSQRGGYCTLRYSSIDDEGEGKDTISTQDPSTPAPTPAPAPATY
jgi:hypothetical protein